MSFVSSHTPAKDVSVSGEKEDTDRGALIPATPSSRSRRQARIVSLPSRNVVHT